MHPECKWKKNLDGEPNLYSTAADTTCCFSGQFNSLTVVEPRTQHLSLKGAGPSEFASDFIMKYNVKLH